MPACGPAKSPTAAGPASADSVTKTSAGYDRLPTWLQNLLGLGMAKAFWLHVGVIASSFAGTGCPNNSAQVDAALDAKVDASIDATVDAGRCGADYFLTGDLVDWDSTEANFRGVFPAVFSVEGEPARMDQTSPNGRFELCIVAAARTRLNVDAPGAGDTGYVDAILIADKSVTDAIGFVSTRSFRNARAAEFFTQQGIAGGYDATKAQLLVQTVGTPRAVTIDRVASPVALDANNVWAAGAAGSEVLFPNLDPATATVNVGSSGTVLGAGAVPLVAGKLTFVTLVLQ